MIFTRDFVTSDKKSLFVVTRALFLISFCISWQVFTESWCVIWLSKNNASGIALNIQGIMMCFHYVDINLKSSTYQTSVVVCNPDLSSLFQLLAV